MISIEVKINGRLISEARAINVSNLADISDYMVKAYSSESRITGLPEQDHAFDIRQHQRNQSAWALVAKIAEIISAEEHAALMKLAAEHREKQL